jgi:hypothetical protein
VKVFTTVNPFGNYDSQSEALKSWSKHYDVYSVNPQNEIEIAKEKFPYINFIETHDTFQYGKKNLVKLNSILQNIRMENGLCAIVNSDIILNKEIKIDDIGNDLVIATRWEIDGDKRYPFVNGYDLFIFDAKLTDIYMNPNYVIGMPWWDFWIPLIAIQRGLRVLHISNQSIFHRTHETNYDGDIWITFAEHLYRDVVINLLSQKFDIDIFTFCQTIKKYIEGKQINIKT